MNAVKKNKVLIGLVALLLIANTVSIIFLWLDKDRRPPGNKGTPAAFLIKELSLDAKQQEQFGLLVKEHQSGAVVIRNKIKAAKEAFFDLLKQPSVSDSARLQAADAISVQTEELDLLTFSHFQKVRALCTAEQQLKFDNIIQDALRKMGSARPHGPGGPPPPSAREENGPPLPPVAPPPGRE